MRTHWPDLYSKLRGLLNFKAVTSVIHYKVLLHSNSILIYILLFPCIPLDKTANIKSLHMYSSIVLRCIHTPLYHILNFNLEQKNIKID